MRKPKPRSSRTRVRPRVTRWLAVATLAIVALLYYRPLKSYLETRAAVQEREAQVHELRAKRAVLARRLEDAETPEALARRARRLGLVKPGEQLFIVKGIDRWLRKAKE